MFHNRYRLYTVHINPEQDQPYENAEFIAEGFNFYAFFFHALWLLYNRIWISGIVIMSLMAFIVGLGSVFSFNPASVLVLRLGVQLMVGFQANDLLRAKLESQGYIMIDTVAGSSLLEAQQRYFDRHFASVGEAGYRQLGLA